MANSYVFYANKNGRPTGLPGFRGPKGEQGEQGLQGIQGEQGDPGVFIGSEEDMPAGTRVRLDPNGSPDTAAVINDTNISTAETWSSSKISEELNKVEIIELELDETKFTAGFMYLIKRVGHCTVVGNNLKINSSISGQVDVLPVGALPKAAVPRWFMTPMLGFPLSNNVTVTAKGEFCGTYGGEGKLTMWIDSATSEISHFFTLTYPYEVT